MPWPTWPATWGTYPCSSSPPPARANWVEEALAARAAFLARLLAGEMPPDIEEAFAAAPLEDCLAHFFEPGNGLTALGPAASPRTAPVPDAALRELDDPTIEIRGRPLAEILAPAYAAMTQAAERRALGGGAQG